jgi:signal transduction histidine kinase
VDVCELVDSVVGLLAATTGQTRVALRSAVSPDVPGQVVGDEIRLRQILFNLVGNGLKFTGQGTVSLEVHALRAGGPRRGLLFVVSDTGPGMADEHLSTAFETFGQVSQGLTRPHQGAGLGLPIVKRIIDLMGGTLCVDSAPGQGTTVYVSLPLPPALDSARGVSSADETE